MSVQVPLGTGVEVTSGGPQLIDPLQIPWKDQRRLEKSILCMFVNWNTLAGRSALEGDRVDISQFCEIGILW
ncbi:hypothetical protein DPMN_065380 [Dreissena polymorpha]|uniref:Uncharacterized protein n=1 Tax=Dreissena polymorpha TaxID=45954 RepID=A0A9D3YVA8_DREPO|nr:hypothetical protein DPMN_065380 [Dreissena polymorpha]